MHGPAREVTGSSSTGGVLARNLVQTGPGTSSNSARIMQRSSVGFTLIELIIAIVIGSILTTVALSRISDARARLAVRGAQNTYASVHARARVHGIEMGENVELHVASGGDSIWIQHNGAVLEKVRFDGDNVDLKILPNTTTDFHLCFTPRGYTDTSCNSTASILRLWFVQGTDSLGIWMLPMGQLLVD